MSPIKKTLLSVAVIVVAGTIAAGGVFSAFSSTTTNPNDTFGAGSVAISDNDSGTALYSVSNSKPGDSSTRCIRVTYTGTLAATVKVYRSAFTSGTGLDPYVNLTITKGSGTQGNCSDFAAAASGASVYSSTLSAFPTSWSDGAAITLNDQDASAVWDQNDAVTYQFTVSLADDNNANGKVTGTHSFTWEARNN